MNELDKLINQLIKEEGGTKQQYLHLLKSVANHETGGTMDPFQLQNGGGPGRGKYQFEVGKNAGGITAAKRLKTYYNNKKIPVPKWLEEVTKYNDLDVTTLTEEQQDLLFLGNMKQHPKADLAKVFKGEESIPEFWANYHWAGDKRERDKKIKNFSETFEEFKPAPIEYEKNVIDIDKKKDGVSVFKPLKKEINIQALIPKNNINKNIFALGGNTESSRYNNSFSNFAVGGTHEQNPNGGIPLGIGVNGKPNTVEQGESSYNFKDLGKFIFSNRIFTNGNIIKK